MENQFSVVNISAYSFHPKNNENKETIHPPGWRASPGQNRNCTPALAKWIAFVLDYWVAVDLVGLIAAMQYSRCGAFEVRFYKIIGEVHSDP